MSKHVKTIDFRTFLDDFGIKLKPFAKQYLSSTRQTLATWLDNPSEQKDREIADALYRFASDIMEKVSESGMVNMYQHNKNTKSDSINQINEGGTKYLVEALQKAEAEKAELKIKLEMKNKR